MYVKCIPGRWKGSYMLQEPSRKNWCTLRDVECYTDFGTCVSVTFHFVPEQPCQLPWKQLLYYRKSKAESFEKKRQAITSYIRTEGGVHVGRRTTVISFCSCIIKKNKGNLTRQIAINRFINLPTKRRDFFAVDSYSCLSWRCFIQGCMGRSCLLVSAKQGRLTPRDRKRNPVTGLWTPHSQVNHTCTWCNMEAVSLWVRVIEAI